MSDLDDMNFDEWLDQEKEALEAQERVPAGGPEAPVSRRAARRAAEQEPEREPASRQVYWDERQYEPEPERAPRSGKGVWGWWKLVLLPLTAVLLAGVIALGVGFSQARKVADITTIFPNVRVNGVDVGGMTVAQAAAALGEDPAKYDDAAVTVTFTTGDSITVTAQQLGLKPVDGTAFAQAAYNYGRDGTLLTNLRAYKACQSKPMDMAVCLAEQPGVDRAALEAIVTPVAQQVNEKLGVTEVRISPEDVTLVKNGGARQVDVQDLCGRIADAFEQENYAPIAYEATAVDESQGLDRDSLLQQIYDEVYAAPADAMYDPVTGGVTDSVTGVRFDMDEARRLWDEAADGEQIVIPLIKEEPALTGEQLSGMLFADVLAEKSTTLAGSGSARINNITLAAQAMNGVVLQPGQEFDYNTCLGQRTAARGYQEAGVYSNGKHDTALGGGICQGSSTLYYCALYANLDITVRYDHYFTVSYLPMGLDATVSWGGPEFRFRNSRDYPIRIEAYVANGSLTVRLLGTNVDGSYVVMTSDTWEDSEFYYAQTYRNVYDANGNLVSSNKEAYSRYHKYEAVDPTPAPTQPPVQNDGGQVDIPPAADVPVTPDTPVEPETPQVPDTPETPAEPLPDTPPETA